MIRILLFRLALFAIPFGLYALYLQLAKRRPGMNVPDTPWFWLIVTGLVLVIASFLYVGLTEGETTSGVYVAPHVVNGRVVPGHVDTGTPK